MHNDEDLSPRLQRAASSTSDAAVSNGTGRPIHLTPRESQIARFVILGESNKQIARRLGISDYTVRDHVSNLLRKAGATRRSRLALLLSPRPPSPDGTVAHMDSNASNPQSREGIAGQSVIRRRADIR
jgi:DNA-binding NarL/FixJ family response regulator